MEKIVDFQTEIGVRALSFFVSFLPPFLLSVTRYRPLAAVLAVWYCVAYFLSRIPLLHEVGTWHYDAGDKVGFLIFANIPVLPLILFYAWYKNSPPLKSFLMKAVPPWGYIIIQVYRLGGLSYLVMRNNGVFPDYFGLQVGLLDGFMGVTAIPLACYVYKVRLENCRNIVYIWNVIGMYDLVSAFTVTFGSFFGVVNMTMAPTGMASFPMTLVIYFQVPLAIMIHGLFLVDIDTLIAARKADPTVDPTAQKVD